MIYLIDGEERLLVDEAVKKIKEESLPKQARDFNFDAFNGKEANLVKIVGAAQMLPAFAPSRLVLVENADKMKLDDDAAEVLLNYLAKPSPTTTLVFVGEKFDARSKVFKASSQAARDAGSDQEAGALDRRQHRRPSDPRVDRRCGRRCERRLPSARAAHPVRRAR
jgi:DNA polymerase III delta subunit